MLNFDQSFASDCASSNTEPTAQTAAVPAVSAHLPLGLLQAVLNQVDYGLAVVDAASHRLVFANVQAQSAMQVGGPAASGLYVKHGYLHARDPQHAEVLSAALAKTVTRVRGLLRLGGNASELSVAVMPLAGFVIPAAEASQVHIDSDDDEYDYVDTKDAPAQESSLALLVFAKQQLCDTTTVTLFARESGLTSAEGQVLAQVCKGLRPAQIATHQGVQVSTVRTQLRAIRHKTASDSMRELVRKVSSLPQVARYLPSFLGGGDSGFAA
jgi:DNA-binding CsgD family transcriptional regulator